MLFKALLKLLKGAQGYALAAVFLPSGLRYSFLGTALSDSLSEA